jgi:hypothetical protein
MKKLLLFFLLVHNLYAQMGLLSPYGVEFPRFSAAARPAPSTVGVGTMLFNSTNSTHQYSDGTTWRNVSALPPAGISEQTLRYDGNNWVGSDLMRNDGRNLLIGVPIGTSYSAKMSIESSDLNINSGIYIFSKTSGLVSSSRGIAINAESTDLALKAVTSGRHSAYFLGRILLGPNVNNQFGDGGIEFRPGNYANSIGFIGMRGTNELGVFGYGYNDFIQRWNINTGSICYATTPTVCSDIRLKKDFRRLSQSAEKINQLQGYQYYWKNEKSPDLQTGLIAQEVQKIFPELVKTDEEGMLSVDYVGLIPHLIEANKSLSARIEKLEAALLKQH